MCVHGFHVTSLCVCMPQVAFSVAVVLAYYLFLAPVLRGLNKELQNTRSSMLLFPEEVVNGVPALKGMMREFARSTRA